MTNISITTDDTLEVTYSVSSDTGSLDEILNIKKNNTEQNLTNVNVKNVKKFTWSPTSEHKNKTYKFTHTGDSEDLIVEVSANIIDNFEYSPQGPYDNTEEYILLLDGEKQGPVDEDSLRELASDLHMSFTVFRDVE